VHKRYSYDDFPFFNVTPLHTPVFDSSIDSKLEAMDITQDEEYKDSPSYARQLTATYTPFLALDPSLRAAREREMFYIRHSSFERGYGLFASKVLRKGEIVGLYSGSVCANTATDCTDYRWVYPTRIEGGNRPDCGIDGRREGNYMRYPSLI
jgi:hypothetical protein